jgi:hypothetical protein
VANGLSAVRSYRDVLDAQAAVSKLESEGVESFLANEYTVGVLWRLSTALGGVEVQVAAEDLERARTILGADESGELASLTAASPIPLSESCPRCGSEDLIVVKWSRYAAALATLTGIPIPYFRTRVKCRSCGKQWRPPVA